MSTITLIGAGQMASALTYPLFENGHEVRLVGSPLDDQVIDRLREDNYHVNLLRILHDGIHFCFFHTIAVWIFFFILFQCFKNLLTH